MKMIKIGDIVEVTITGVQPYGAFATLSNHLTGLIHISEISEGFVKDIENFVHKGEKVRVKVIDIDNATNQAKLSLKAIDSKSKRRERRLSYKNQRKQIRETPKGFEPLKEMLPIWITEELMKLEEKIHD
ncbi:MAG: CvfD/Ygs/GSP13 family RNA-binding post-transcriptional regulator [Beduini sp.]|uniref:CvfD/Ygs/GSP13 family RNA-binding post-transcriptional regulator n=1 Tax=Beduini sp. TaxID=1922300 RepID=UPI003990C34F